MIEFKNKKVGILGIGIEGLSSAAYLKKQGALVTILDQKQDKDLDPALLEQIETLKVPLKLGEGYLDNLSEFAVLVRSPGIKLTMPQLQDALKKGVVITSQTKLFFDLCPGKIIGVTGTKGKGTTASLIYEMLKLQGFDAYLGGNIGKPPFEFLDTVRPQSWIVLELSSFQLQDLTKSPHIAVILMVTSEHLDYHADTNEYVNAKRNILRFQTPTDYTVINRDYVASNESDIHTQGKVFRVSREREKTQGCYVRNGTIWLRMKDEDYEVYEVEKILLPGAHNLENVCASVMAATLAGVSLENIRKVLTTFKGLEHRLELVRTVNGVLYYDDSFSTTPETAIAAIEAFAQPEILILGGSSKGSDFSELGRIIAETKNIRAIIGIGVEWARIKTSIKKQVPSIMYIEGAKDMKTIVAAASKIAQSGDVVLLSPACASFGMFKNYKDRGDQFKIEVQKLQ